MEWEVESISESLDYSLFDPGDFNKMEVELAGEGVKVKFSRSVVVDGRANISSTLFILDLVLNGTTATCEVSAGVVGVTDNVTLSICIIGKCW